MKMIFIAIAIALGYLVMSIITTALFAFIFGDSDDIDFYGMLWFISLPLLLIALIFTGFDDLLINVSLWVDDLRDKRGDENDE